jgi:dTDP-4-dehydrorhamnose reductase
MRVLVLGGEGMLGHKMFQRLVARFPDTACTIRGRLDDPFFSKIDLFRSGRVLQQVDAMDLSSLGHLLSSLEPAYVVNCVGIIKQRSEASQAIPSITLNALLPHMLVEMTRGWGGRVIHVSTDCVFSGKRGRYTEDDPSDAEDLYGKTKYLGELTAENGLTLRTSIIGRELASFGSLLEWFLSQQGKRVRGFTRVLYSGVTTNYLSGLVGDIIADSLDLVGLYQVTSPTLSKHDLLCRLRDAYGMAVDIVPDDSEVSDRSLVGDRFIAATGYRQPSWPELIEQLVGDPTPYDQWRQR